MQAKKLFTASTLGLSLLLTGCGVLPTGAATAPPTQAPLVGAAGWVPSTFSTDGIWNAATDDNTPLASGLSGIASITGHVITVRDGATGAIEWSSAGITGTPALSFASDGGKEYLLAVYGNGSPDARIDAYLTTRSGESITPSSSTHFTGDPAGKGAAGPVAVKAYAGGALVSTGSTSQVFRPGHPDAAMVSSQSVAAVNDATLVVDPAGNFGLESLTGVKVWSSASLKPSGTAPGSHGTFLAADNGLIVAKWPGTDGRDLAVFIRAVGGVVAASAPVAAGEATGAFLASSDGRWGVYAHRVFNAATGVIYELPADFKPALVDRSVVYSSDAHGNAYDPIGKSQIPSPNGSPKLVTPQGQGVFLSGTEMTVAQMNTLGVKRAG